MFRVIKKVVFLLAISSVALAGRLPPCDEVNVKVEDPDGILTRLEKSINTDILKRLKDFAVGSNSKMGIAYEVEGTGKCVKDASYEAIYPAVPMGANCVVEGAQGIGWNFVTLGKDIATGTIEAIGNTFDIDAQNLGKMGNEFVEEKLELLKSKQNRTFGELLAVGGLNFLDYLSHLVRLSSMGVGQLVKGIAVRLEALFLIPKEIVEQGIHIAQHAWLGDTEAMANSAKRIGWRIYNSPKALVMGCEPSLPK